MAALPARGCPTYDMALQPLSPCQLGEFPRLLGSWHEVTSPKDTHYNCIAYSLGYDNHRWWPYVGHYWPPDAPFTETLEAFEQVYRNHRFEPCHNGDLEQGFMKIAIYIDQDGIPTHASKQLLDGTWSSKLGLWQDIMHSSAEAIGGGLYGEVALFMKRPIQ